MAEALRLTRKPVTTDETANSGKKLERPTQTGVAAFQLVHHWDSGDPDHRLVGEIDNREHEEQRHHGLSAVAVVSPHWTSAPSACCCFGQVEG
jgi:hypothetical protein